MSSEVICIYLKQTEKTQDDKNKKKKNKNILIFVFVCDIIKPWK